MKDKVCINPMSGMVLRKTVNILTYGISEEQQALIYDGVPNGDTIIIDCSECFSEIIVNAYIAVVINPDFLEDEGIEYFNEYADEVGWPLGKIIFSKPHPILQKLSKNIRYTVFADDYEFADRIKYILLDASRSEKRAKSYSDTIAQTVRVLSEIRQHPYITTAELATIVERNPRTVQRYITTLACAGEFIEYDRKKRGWYLYENKSALWGDY